MKWYRQSFDYVLYDMSYENLVLYGATIPSIDTDKKDNKNNDKSDKNEVIRADDPANWDKMRSLFKNSK